MPLLSRDEGIRVLGPHFASLYEIVTDPWAEYLREYTDRQRSKHCSTTRAGIIHDLTVYKASAYFMSIPGSRVIDSMGLKLFTLEDDQAQVAIRFKKFDDELLPRNQSTRQVRKFRNQRQLDLVGAAYHIEAGYVLSPDQTSIELVSVVCPNGRKNFWDITLTQTKAITKVRDIFDSQEASDEVNIVRGKTPAEKENRSDNDAKGK